MARVLLALLLSGCSVDWNRHDAWKHCTSAINAWPGRPAPSCEALQMCANEAPLSPAQSQKLKEMMQSAHCALP